MAHASTTVALVATVSWIAAMLLLIAVSRPGPGAAPVRDGWPVDPPALAVGAPEAGADPFSPYARDVVWSNRDGTWRKVPLAHGRGLFFGSSPRGGLAALLGALPFLAVGAVILGYLTLGMSAGRVAEILADQLVHDSAFPPL